MSERLLRQFITEVLNAPNPGGMGKNNASAMLYPDSNGMPVGVKPSTNILDDEADEEQMAKQTEKQAACCLILSDDGKVLAVSRKDDPTAFGMPGGKVDPGEDAETAAARELQEETGLVATKLHQVFVRKETDGYTTTTFVAEVTGEIDTPESGIVRWVTPDVLFAGPFGTYNKLLWKKLGLPTSAQ